MNHKSGQFVPILMNPKKKRKYSKVVSFQITPSLALELRQITEERNMSISDFCRDAIRKGIEAYRKERTDG